MAPTPSSHRHRPFPPPAGPWVLRQKLNDLLFMHWAVAPEKLEPLLPKPLELDLYKGQAWVGMTAFRVTGLRPRGLPPMPGVSSFPELNVRTYVRHKGVPGVHFFSLDVPGRLAVNIARYAYAMPYHRAEMKATTREGKSDGSVRFRSRRLAGNGDGPAEFSAAYYGLGHPREARPGSFEEFLTERYCLFAVKADGSVVVRGDIHHAPWRLQPADCEIEANTVAAAAGIDVGKQKPILHYCKNMEFYIWKPQTVA